MGFLLFDIAEYLLSLESAKDFKSVRNSVELAPNRYRQGYDNEIGATWSLRKGSER